MKIPESLFHAYLITGGREESRLTYAEKLAAAYLCDGGKAPCGNCRHCRKVAANSHPDLTQITPPEGKREIVVGQARALRADAYIRPNEGKRKVYIIDPADAMNEEAQNALLKVLEEGPQYTAFLLLAGEPGRMLETIRSRCEQLVLQPEEETPDPELLDRAEQLAQLLLCGDELAVAEGMIALEQEKQKSAELAELLLLTERCVANRLVDYPKRAVKLLHILRTCRANQIYYPGPGHTLGWIMTELFR